MGVIWDKYKTFIIIILAVIALWVIYKIVQGNKRKNLIQDDYDTLLASGQKPSYSNSSYIQMADKIYEAGCPSLLTTCYGTDEDAILNVFDQMNNEIDVILLIRGFGSRQPRGTAWTDEVDLGGFLQSELDGDVIKLINDKLARKGIKARF